MPMIHVSYVTYASISNGVEDVPFIKNCLPFLSKNLLPTASMVGVFALTATVLRAAAPTRIEERMLTEAGSAKAREKYRPRISTIPSFANVSKESN